MPAKSAGGAKASATKKTTKRTTKSAKPKAQGGSAEKPAARTAKKAGGAKLRVRQIRSTIGRRADFRRTLQALGIRHHQDEVVVTRSPAIDGMLNKVRHLVRVTPEE